MNFRVSNILHPGKLDNEVEAEWRERENRDGSSSCLHHLTSQIHPDAEIGAGTVVGRNSVVEANVVIGNIVWIGSNCTICSKANIGNMAQIEDGVAINSGEIVPQRAVVKNKQRSDGRSGTRGVSAEEIKPLRRLAQMAPQQGVSFQNLCKSAGSTGSHWHTQK